MRWSSDTWTCLCAAALIGNVILHAVDASLREAALLCVGLSIGWFFAGVDGISNKPEKEQEGDPNV